MLFLFGDSHPVVLYLKPVPTLLNTSIDLNQAVCLRCLAGVVKKVHENGFYQVCLCPHKALVIVEIYFRALIKHIHIVEIDKQGFNGNHGEIHFAAPRDHDVQQPEGHGLQPFAFRIDIVGRHELLFLVQLAGAQHIRISDNGGEGCLQFVGKCGHEILPCLYLLLQLPDVVFQRIGHLVKVRCELAQFIAADLPGAVMIIPGRHALGRTRQQTDRPGQPGGYQMHDEGAAYQHGNSYLAVYGKAQGPFPEHIRHIP